jgi:hypothetical protein
MKIILTLFISLILMACQYASTTDATHTFIMPEELEECKLIQLKSEKTLSPNQYAVHILKCPDGYRGTSTSYYQGNVYKNNSLIFE